MFNDNKICNIIYNILRDNQPRYSKVIMTVFVTMLFSISSLVSLGYGSYVIDKYLK
ncbi:MAG: hypothetical protein ACRC3Y_16835 [Romboutsia sp.]|uniref:hypothetical protein n=1 Tax=Romboutsia sp. TaxID=1965302 RepID=UPI003F3B1515